jgi:hypothetical protein
MGEYHTDSHWNCRSFIRANLGWIDAAGFWISRSGERSWKKTEVRSQKSGVGSQKSGVGSQEIENLSWKDRLRNAGYWVLEHIEIFIVVIGVIWLLAKYWLPLGPAKSLVGINPYLPGYRERIYAFTQRRKLFADAHFHAPFRF